MAILYFEKVEKEEKVDLMKWAEHRHKMLFVLDGLDECNQVDVEVINNKLARVIISSTLIIISTSKRNNHRHHDDGQVINKLLGGLCFSGAQVLATSRPLSSSRSAIHVHKFTKVVAIKGFNRERIQHLVEDHFKNRKGLADRLLHLLFEHQAYQSLVACPLLCKLFCYIFGQDEELSEKVTEVYYRLIQNLIRQDIIRREGKLQSSDEIPPEYKEALVKFGRLCIEALGAGKFYFTLDEIGKNLPDSMHSSCPDVIMGFLVKTPASNKQLHAGDCYQPLHKTFLEFVASFFLCRFQIHTKLILNGLNQLRPAWQLAAFDRPFYHHHTSTAVNNIIDIIINFIMITSTIIINIIIASTIFTMTMITNLAVWSTGQWTWRRVWQGWPASSPALFSRFK